MRKARPLNKVRHRPGYFIQWLIYVLPAYEAVIDTAMEDQENLVRMRNELYYMDDAIKRCTLDEAQAAIRDACREMEELDGKLRHQWVQQGSSCVLLLSIIELLK